jgi:AcrR family transcriptional regulator
LSTTSTTVRKDAQRNRELLLAAARSAFSAADDSVALETIARDAGVGIGTLYRHFPSREALVEAVYAAELDDVTASARILRDTLPADEALQAWMSRYAEFFATKRGMIGVLRAGWASGRISAPTTRARVTAAIASILDAGARSGALRSDVDPDDVTSLVVGAFVSATPDRTSEQTDRLLSLIVDGLRPRN